MIYLIGLGLFDEKDISLKGLEACKDADEVYAEFYTSRLHAPVSKIEKLIGKKIKVLKRSQVEEDQEFLKAAKKKKVAFLVAGDPLSATTHTELVLRAKKEKIRIQVIHSSSILTAIGVTGLQLYKFGRVTTLPYPYKGHIADSPYDVIAQNLTIGLHTLVLLDIKAEENKYMTANDAIKILQKIEEKHNEGIFTPDTKIVVLARAGSSKPLIRYGTIAKLVTEDFGKPLHVLIVPSKLHFMEEEFLANH